MHEHLSAHVILLPFFSVNFSQYTVKYAMIAAHKINTVKYNRHRGKTIL